jgi:hypothetical protein
MRDVYSVEDEIESFAAWRAGHRLVPADRDSWWNDYHGWVADAVARGVAVRRARVVSEPVTEYIRYEHSGTFRVVQAGECVRWLPREHASDLMLPGNDLWIFDDRLIRFGLFTGDGQFVRHVLNDDPDVVQQCNAAFEAVWSRATPHDQYRV